MADEIVHPFAYKSSPEVFAAKYPKTYASMPEEKRRELGPNAPTPIDLIRKGFHDAKARIDEVEADAVNALTGGINFVNERNCSTPTANDSHIAEVDDKKPEDETMTLSGRTNPFYKFLKESDSFTTNEISPSALKKDFGVDPSENVPDFAYVSLNQETFGRLYPKTFARISESGRQLFPKENGKVVVSAEAQAQKMISMDTQSNIINELFDTIDKVNEVHQETTPNPTDRELSPIELFKLKFDYGRNIPEEMFSQIYPLTYAAMSADEHAGMGWHKKLLPSYSSLPKEKIREITEAHNKRMDEHKKERDEKYKELRKVFEEKNNGMNADSIIRGACSMPMEPREVTPPDDHCAKILKEYEDNIHDAMRMFWKRLHATTSDEYIIQLYADLNESVKDEIKEFAENSIEDAKIALDAKWLDECFRKGEDLAILTSLLNEVKA